MAADHAYCVGVLKRRLVDVGLAVCVLVVAEIVIVAGREVESAPRDGLAYLLGGAMALPLLLRRRFPVGTLYAVAAALLLFYVLGYPGFPPSLVLAVPLYDAVREGRLWWAIPVPTGFFSAGLFVTIRHGTPASEVVAVFLSEIALVVVAMLLGGLIRSRRAYAGEVRERLRLVEEEREQEAKRRVAEERLRIAREVHDTVAHAIATITVQSGAALHLVDRDPGRVREALTAIRQTGKATLEEMRTTLAVLRTDGEPSTVGDHDAGLSRLPALLAAVRAAGLGVAEDVAGADVPLKRQVDHAVYRVLQESLTNVLRHAGPAARATLHVKVAREAVTVEVVDDGVGAAADTGGGGHGMAGMRERVAALGGRFEAGPLSDGGFRVWACLPREAGNGWVVGEGGAA